MACRAPRQSAWHSRVVLLNGWMPTRILPVLANAPGAADPKRSMRWPCRLAPILFVLLGSIVSAGQRGKVHARPRRSRRCKQWAFRHENAAASLSGAT